MTVRIAKAELRILALVTVFVVPLLTAGCTTSPEPYYGWDTQSDTPRKVATVKPKPRPRYTQPRYNETQYADNSYNRSYCSCNDTRMPTARPSYSSKYDQPADPRDEGNYYRPRPNSDYANANVRFQWPVRGRVVTEFGSYPSGEKNNGINIAASQHEPIRAAADGVVSYSGDELRNYGNLLLIKHDGGYITAYAHADQFIVQKGDRVARGQVIGYVGSTGDVRTPQLHFELRRGSHGETPVDPRQYLGSQQYAER